MIRPVNNCIYISRSFSIFFLIFFSVKQNTSNRTEVCEDNDFIKNSPASTIAHRKYLNTFSK